MKITLVTFLVFLLMGHCKKDEINQTPPVCNSSCVLFSGIVLDNKGTPLSGASVSLGWLKPSMGIISNEKIIQTIKTDASGSFSFKYAPQDNEIKDGEFFLESSKENYLYDKIENRKVFITGTYKYPDMPNVVNLTLYPKASLAITLKSQSSTPLTSFGLKVIYGGNSHHLYTFYNRNLDTTINCFCAGNQFNQIKWFITKDGIDETYVDSVFCNSAGSNTFKLAY